MERLSKDDPEFFSKISKMRKTKSGGKTFADKQKAREAQKKGVETRRQRSLSATPKRPEA